MRIRAAIALLAVAAAACTSESPPEPPDPSPAGTPPPGTIRLGYPAEPPTLDPAAPSGEASATRDVLRPVLPGLFRLGSDLRPEPELASGWPGAGDVSLDPFSVRLGLREASWSDGEPITASDVRFTWERLRDGPTGARYRSLRDVEVVSSRRLVLRFDRPVRRWWALFSVDDMVLPAHAYDESWRDGPSVGGGPFLFAGWTKGLKVQLRRNPDWFGGAAGAEAIEVVVVPDDENRLDLLERGDLDAVFAPGEGNYGYRAGAHGFDPVEGALADGGASGAWGPSWWELDLNLDRMEGALADAVLLALERSLVWELLEDSGQVMQGIPSRFPVRGAREAGRPAIPGAWSGLGGDLEAARSRLEEAGYRREGERLMAPGGGAVEPVLAFDGGSAVANGIARFVHFRLRELGIRTEIVGIAADRFEREWVVEGRADAYVRLRRGADAPDAAVYRSGALPPGRTPGIDEAIDRAETARSPERLGEGPVVGLDSAAWQEVTEGLREARSVAPLARVRTWIVARPGVSGPRAVGASTGPLWNAAEWRIAGG